jgi:hypothetical protein
MSLHIIPPGELAEHTTDGCVCRPATEPFELDDGSVRPAIVHHTLAGNGPTDQPGRPS